MCCQKCDTSVMIVCLCLRLWHRVITGDKYPVLLLLLSLLSFAKQIWTGWQACTLTWIMLLFMCQIVILSITISADLLYTSTKQQYKEMIEKNPTKHKLPMLSDSVLLISHCLVFHVWQMTQVYSHVVETIAVCVQVLSKPVYSHRGCVGPSDCSSCGWTRSKILLFLNI